MRRLAIVVAAPLGALVAVLPPANAALAVTNGRMTCSAHMSVVHPQRHSTTDVIVKSWGGATVTTVAHYKTTTTTHHGKTSTSTGKATIPYHIEGATIGYKVTVNVKVSKGNQSAACSTSFTPS